jgi:SAM-dependent methyltransferase
MSAQPMWNERYSEPGFAYGTQPNDFLASVVNLIPPGRVLSLAEGEGRNAIYLAERGYEVVAVDSSTVGMEKANRLAAEHKVKINTIVADLTDYQIKPASWSGIVSIFCHMPPVVRAALHRDVVAALKPGGVFVLEAYTPAQLKHGTGGPAKAELLMSLDQLKAELAGLKFVHAIERVRDVIEGKYHTGRAAVVQLVGVKPAERRVASKSSRWRRRPDAS